MSPNIGKTLITRVRRRIADSDGVLALTGPGILADSGINGFVPDDKNESQETINADTFHQDPVKVWEWYDARRQEVARAIPGPAHQALSRLEKTGKSVFIITQNTDDLHEKAGSTQVVHLYGSLWRVRCERDGFVEENREVPLSYLPPLCPCGNELRPDVVWFQEPLPSHAIAAVRKHLLEARSNVMLIIGVEAAFGYTVQWAHEAREQGVMVVTINPRASAVDQVADLHIPGHAGTVLPQLVP